nr:hypothetical protein [Marinicella sp. W31]MDC2880202.1 hypothetical protein [Marinicella sp. W31]
MDWPVLSSSLRSNTQHDASRCRLSDKRPRPASTIIERTMRFFEYILSTYRIQQRIHKARAALAAPVPQDHPIFCNARMNVSAPEDRGRGSYGRRDAKTEGPRIRNPAGLRDAAQGNSGYGAEAGQSTGRGQVIGPFRHVAHPVREALLRLSGDALVTTLPNRNTIVSAINFAEMPHYFEALTLMYRATTKGPHRGHRRDRR